MLVLLAKCGLVERGAHPVDARARIVALTPAGELKFRQVLAAGEGIREEMVASFRPDQTAVLVELLTRVAEALNTNGASTGNRAPATRERIKT
jgi:DNA-binding MarR family transcriptional regulator